MANISFGERVRRARIRNAMSQAELGSKVGVTQAAISNWEQGKVVPGADQKASLKKILGSFWTEANAGHGESATSQGAHSTVGAWLTKARIDRHFSVPELAAKAGLSGQAIYNIEQGRIANPRGETVKKSLKRP